MARSTIPSKARRLLAALALSATAALAADVPADILELHTRCVASTAGIDLVFELRNRSERTVWIVNDTEPWAPSFLSTRMVAERQDANPQRLKGPIAVGHSAYSVKVPPSGTARGAISLSHTFPELAQAAQQNPVRIRWRWQGLVGASSAHEKWEPTASFEGEVTVQGSACSQVTTRRL